MRSNVILLLWCMCSMAHAQDTYESVLQDGMTWRMEYHTISYPGIEFTYWHENMVLKGDTLIDDIPFKRVFSLSPSDSGENILKPRGYWIGQKGSIVYQYEENDDWEQKYYPIMDFSLDVGDEFTLYDEDPYDDEQRVWELERFRVVAVSDTVLASSTDKRPRHCVRVQPLLTGRPQDCWVEGIGSLEYGIMGRREFHLGSGTLVQCTNEDEVLYSSGSAVSIHETLTHQSSDDAFFDLQGRRLVGQPQKGISIRNGKKYVVK